MIFAYIIKFLIYYLLKKFIHISLGYFLVMGLLKFLSSISSFFNLKNLSKTYLSSILNSF
jgi:uncharacterized membrane protein